MWYDYWLTGLMIIGQSPDISSQIKHLSGQIKFDQTNLLYTINGKIIDSAKDN